MKMIEESNGAYYFELSSGRRFYANGHMLGLGPDWENPSRLIVGYGSDGDVYIDHGDNPWTSAEREELADYMIALWQQWKNANA